MMRMMVYFFIITSEASPEVTTQRRWHSMVNMKVFLLYANQPGVISLKHEAVAMQLDQLMYAVKASFLIIIQFR